GRGHLRRLDRQRSALPGVFEQWEGTMKRVFLMSAVAAVLMSTGLAAQGRNFSGTWTMDAEKTAAANAGLAGAGGRGGGGGGVARGGGDAGVAAVAVAGGGGGRGGGGA